MRTDAPHRDPAGLFPIEILTEHCVNRSRTVCKLDIRTSHCGVLRKSFRSLSSRTRRGGARHTHPPRTQGLVRPSPLPSGLAPDSEMEIPGCNTWRLRPHLPHLLFTTTELPTSTCPGSTQPAACTRIGRQRTPPWRPHTAVCLSICLSAPVKPNGSPLGLEGTECPALASLVVRLGQLTGFHRQPKVGAC